MGFWVLGKILEGFWDAPADSQGLCHMLQSFGLFPTRVAGHASKLLNCMGSPQLVWRLLKCNALPVSMLKQVRVGESFSCSGHAPGPFWGHFGVMEAVFFKTIS